MIRPAKFIARAAFALRILGLGTIAAAGAALVPTTVFAQQTGEISGSVTDAAGAPVAGVAVEARGDVLPQPRNTTTADNGRYRLPLLPPGRYEVRYRFPDGSDRVLEATVLLQQDTEIPIVFDPSGQAAAMDEVVVLGTGMVADTGQGALKDAIDAATVNALPVGQDYRDLQKLIPGVQYTEDTIRGPSAGGSGQDNLYQIDGVDVTLPLFGTLQAEPSAHDIAQVSIVRGGAKAVGFNRSGGFLMNTVSKSGTNEFSGEVSYQVQSASMTGDLESGENPLNYDEDRDWTVLSLGGPILRDHLFFYTSYYHPTSERTNTANAYGPVPSYESDRDEYFAKLTFAPTDDILIDGSYRTSDKEINNRSVDSFGAASTSIGDTATLDIAILEASWLFTDDTSATFRFTDFENKNSSRPDLLLDFQPSLAAGLDVNALDTQGNFFVPQPIAGEDAYNDFIQPLIDQYGFVENGVATGGGNVGAASTIDDQDYYRTSYEIGLDHTWYRGDVTHELHVGYQYEELEEDLARYSNGWGIIEAPGGRVMATDGVTPIYYRATLSQQSFVGSGDTVPVINSYVETQNFEINDTIQAGDWTLNVGVMFSNDTLFGQGLAPAPEGENPITGYVPSPGTRYEMYEIDWGDMVQPRLGVTWDYSDSSSVYLNYARYHPAASSLARAASWDRNLRSNVDVEFDADGNVIEVSPVSSSSGKWFQDGMEPRKIDELLFGWTMDVSPDISVRAYTRYREGSNFWEDTHNDDRVNYDPPAGIPREPYIPNLDAIRAEIGGSTYVIAQLDDAYTEYWEVSGELEWNLDRLFLRAAYTWSRYTGNFDQDNTTTTNDANIFIGSSFIADEAGRQLWNFRDGELRGDRRHLFKAYGYYDLPWNARTGAFLLYQSGQPWEVWNVEVYRDYTTSTSDASRYAEPAGSRTTGSHWQLDLNYTQNFTFFGDYNLQLRADLFNVFDRQTGYNIQNLANSAGFGDPRDFYLPRRLQLAIKFQF